MSEGPAAPKPPTFWSTPATFAEYVSFTICVVVALVQVIPTFSPVLKRAVPFSVGSINLVPRTIWLSLGLVGMVPEPATKVVDTAGILTKIHAVECYRFIFCSSVNVAGSFVLPPLKN